jgi:hypothetical protein
MAELDDASAKAQAFFAWRSESTGVYLEMF